MNPVAPSVEPVVEVDGAPLAAEAAQALTRIVVDQDLSQPSMCQLTFLDSGGALAGAHGFRPGRALRVGISGRAGRLFDGEVTAIEISYPASAGREIRVRGYDRLHRLRKLRHVRSFAQTTPLDLARELAAAVGLKVNAAEPGPLRQYLFQHNQSDLEFLLGQTESCGMYLSVHDGVLHLLTLSGAGEPYPLDLGGSLREAHFELNADPACRSVTVTGWDPLRAEPHTARAAAASIGRRVAAEAPPKLFGSSGELTFSGAAGRDNRSAQAVAQAELDRRRAAEVVFRGTAEGDPALRPGARVDVVRVAEEFSGRYVLTAVTHTIDSSVGYTSEFSTAPPRSRPREDGAWVTHAVVTRVNDPENSGRVRVSLPSYGGVESDWMQVLFAGGGRSKGFIISPEVDDQVLVVFVHGDAAEGVVLGGLFRGKDSPDPGIEGGAVRRYTLLTGKGQKVQLDDTGGSIRLENSDGSYVEMSPKNVRLHSKRNLDIEAPGRAVVIRGKSIDFQRE